MAYEDSFVVGGGSSGGGSGSGGTTTQRTNKITTIERLMKKTSWVWCGDKTYTQINNLFGSRYRCPKKSVVTSSTYNKRTAAYMTKTLNDNKLVMLDDIYTNNLSLKVDFKANSNLNTYVRNFTFDLFLSSSSSSTTNVRNLVTNRGIENVNKGGVESYNFTVYLADLNTWETPFSRDSYICCKITSNWTYNRAIYFSVKNSSGTTIISEKHIATSKTGCTGNFGITWRECMANNYTLYVEFKQG